MTTTNEKNYQEIFSKLSHIHQASRNVIQKVYSADKNMNYKNNLQIFGRYEEKVNQIGGTYIKSKKYDWLFAKIDDLYIHDITKTYIILRKYSLGDYSRFGNKEYGHYFVEKRIIHEALTHYLKEVRKACYIQKKRHNRVFVQLMGDKTIDHYEEQIKIIKKIQKDIKKESWSID